MGVTFYEFVYPVHSLAPTYLIFFIRCFQRVEALVFLDTSLENLKETQIIVLMQFTSILENNSVSTGILIFDCYSLCNLPVSLFISWWNAECLWIELWRHLKLIHSSLKELQDLWHSLVQKISDRFLNIGI